MHAPVEVDGTVRNQVEGNGYGKQVHLDCGGVQLVVTENAPMAMRPQFYRALGLEPWRADSVVVKSLFPFRWYFMPMNRLTLYVKSTGISDLDIIDRLQTHDPVHPRDRVEHWRPTHQARAAR